MSLARLLDELRCDAFRVRGDASSLGVAISFLTTRTFRPVATLRIIQSLRASESRFGRLVSLPVKVLHRVVCQLASIDFSHETAVASGFCITHGWGAVISPGARIGRNCTVFHGVTLGRKDRVLPDGTRQSGYPVIEDECWIGPHACVLGGVTVGRGSIIGAGAVVVKDVPPHSVVVGNPARIVRSNAVADVFNRPPESLMRRGHPLDASDSRAPSSR